VCVFLSFPSLLIFTIPAIHLASFPPPSLSLCLFSTFPSYTILCIYGFDITFFDTSVSHVLLPSLLSLSKLLPMLLETLNFKFLFVSSIDSSLLGSINLLLLSMPLTFYPLFTFSSSPLYRVTISKLR